MISKKLVPINKFIALDLEMNKPSGKIIQIGACVGDIATGAIIESFSVFVNPNEALNPYIIELTGISQDEVDGGISLEEAYLRLCTFHKKHGSFVNPVTWGGGDSQEIHKQLKKRDPTFFERHSWTFGRRWIDSKTLFVSWRLANGQPIQGGLARSMIKLGLKFEGRKHNAQSDAENTFRVYHKLLDLLKHAKTEG